MYVNRKNIISADAMNHNLRTISKQKSKEQKII